MTEAKIDDLTMNYILKSQKFPNKTKDELHVKF